MARIRVQLRIALQVDLGQWALALLGEQSHEGGLADLAGTANDEGLAVRAG